jgi:hypothetical protein
VRELPRVAARHEPEAILEQRAQHQQVRRRLSRNLRRQLAP